MAVCYREEGGEERKGRRERKGIGEGVVNFRGRRGDEG
jgi:hypothetical protein